MSTINTKVLVLFNSEDTAAHFFSLLPENGEDFEKPHEENLKRIKLNTFSMEKSIRLAYKSILGNLIDFELDMPTSSDITAAQIKSIPDSYFLYFEQFNDQVGESKTSVYIDGKKAKKSDIIPFLSNQDAELALFLAAKVAPKSVKEFLANVDNLSNVFMGKPLFWFLTPFIGQNKPIREAVFRVPDLNQLNERGQNILFHHLDNLFQDSESPLLSEFKLLLENGANPNIVDLDGNTPLHIAVQQSHRMGGNIPVADLIMAGVNPNVRNNDGYMPIHLACKHPSFSHHLQMLLQNYDDDYAKVKYRSNVKINEPSPTGTPGWIGIANNRMRFLNIQDESGLPFELKPPVDFYSGLFERDLNAAILHCDYQKLRELLTSASHIEDSFKTELLRLAIGKNRQDSTAYFLLKDAFKMTLTLTDTYWDDERNKEITFAEELSVFPYGLPKEDTIDLFSELLANCMFADIIEHGEIILNKIFLAERYHEGLGHELINIILKKGSDLSAIKFHNYGSGALLSRSEEPTSNIVDMLAILRHAGVNFDASRFSIRKKFGLDAFKKIFGEEPYKMLENYSSSQLEKLNSLTEDSIVIYQNQKNFDANVGDIVEIKHHGKPFLIKNIELKENSGWGYLVLVTLQVMKR